MIKICISVTSHAFNPLSPVTNCHTFSDPSPLERDVLYGRPLDGLALLCIITRKSLTSSLTFNTLPPISHDNSWFLFPMCITEHLSRLNSICQSCDHLNILLRSSRSISAS